MLQNLEKSGYNRLSRRQVLRVLGCGVGLGVLSGLSGCIQPRPTLEREFPLQAQSCNNCEDAIVSALQKVNPEILRNTRQSLKQALKALHKAQQTKQIKKKQTLEPVNAARKASLQMADHLEQTGFCRALDQKLPHVILQSESLGSLPDKLREEFLQDLREVSISQETPWVRALLNQRKVEQDERQQLAQRIMRQGSYEILRQKAQSLALTTLNPQHEYVDDELLFYSDDWVSCSLAAAACLLLIALAIAACYAAYQAPSWPTIERCLESVAKALAACGLAYRLCFSS